MFLYYKELTFALARLLRPPSRNIPTLGPNTAATNAMTIYMYGISEEIKPGHSLIIIIIIVVVVVVVIIIIIIIIIAISICNPSRFKDTAFYIDGQCLIG